VIHVDDLKAVEIHAGIIGVDATDKWPRGEERTEGDGWDKLEDAEDVRLDRDRHQLDGTRIDSPISAGSDAQRLIGPGTSDQVTECDWRSLQAHDNLGSDG
jgi:hypothetical protein